MQPALTRARLVRLARGWIGTPYRHQASLKGVGCDCLGLLRGLWRETIGPEPEPMPVYTPEWAEVTGGEPLLALARRQLQPREDIYPGSVLIFRWRDGVPAKHLGLASGPDRMIHAHDGARVAEVSIVPGWRRRLAGVFDFPGIRNSPGVTDEEECG